MHHHPQRHFDLVKILNLVFTVVSLAICSCLMVFRVPGLELLETAPNWLLIWLVAWSLNKSVWSSAIAGLVVGWIYDGITLAAPSHGISFIIVGILVASLQKQKYTGEDFISVAFVVFFMTLISETIFAIQYWRMHWLSISEVLPKYQQIAIISAIVTSLWSPVFYYPFNLVQQKLKKLQRKILRYGRSN